VLKGKRGTITTLADAAQFMLGLPEHRKARPSWEQAARLVLDAAHSRAAANTQAAWHQLAKALRYEGWL